MTVKELITDLIDMRMDAQIGVYDKASKIVYYPEDVTKDGSTFYLDIRTSGKGWEKGEEG
jgi:hypothetical protein